jgi:hypothetical protein
LSLLGLLRVMVVAVEYRAIVHPHKQHNGVTDS